MKRFVEAFAQSGDKTEVPNTTQGDGSVSYASGYGPDYEKNLDSDPDAKRIERQKMNQVLFDVTNTLQGFQGNPFPPFFSDTDNGGSPMSYIEGVIVSNSGLLYQSLESNNTSNLTDVSKWSGIGSKNRYVSHGSYFVGDIITGTDGKQYYCNKANNTGNQVNPVGDVTDTWREYPFKKLTKPNQFALVYYNGLVIESGSMQCSASPAWSGTSYGTAAFCTEFGTKPIVIPGVNQNPGTEINIPNVDYGLNTAVFAIVGKSKVQINIQPVKASSSIASDITAVYLAIGYK